MAKIAIVGYGFVGKAVESGFKNNQNEIRIYDPHKGFPSIDSLEEYMPEFTFVCVPTPMSTDGKVDSTIIKEVAYTLKEMPSGVVVIKSTITPDIIKKLCKYKRFVYNPEFLTERNAMNDFIAPQFHIFGGHPEFTKKLRNLYQYNSNCNPAPFYFMTSVEASLVKYGINSFLAMKVVWFNQWKDFTESFGARYNVVSNAIGSDTRIGQSHTVVPGFDNKKGFGGSCFPKDTSAIHSCGPDLTVLKAVIDANNIYRKDYDLDDREIAQGIKYK
jgi:nucleotide sugar dehydrogenase